MTGETGTRASTDPDPLVRHLPRLVRFWDVEAPGEHHRQIPGSMAFVDVSGFTELSERLARHGNVGAEEITRVIDTTFDELLLEAYAHGANLLSFGGDALLLLFEGPGHAPRAAAGAHAMRARLRQIGPFHTRDGDVSLRMSVGVHTGRFDVFMVGRSHREFLVAGPDTTRTVQMEGAAGPGQVLLSPETAAELPAANRGRPEGPGILLQGDPVAETLTFQPATSPPIDLAQFVPAALRTVLAADRVEPEHRPATIAFVHLDGLDELLSQHGAASAATALDELVTAIQRAADDHGVTFLASDVAPDGAKVILATGVPQATGNDQERMLLALRELLGRDHQLPIEIGVTSGHVFSGVVGSEQRRTYTVMGDTVNLAARLMAAAAPGELYATQGVLDASRTTFATTSLPPLQVKGKAAPITAVAVGDAVGTRDSSDEGLPLVGREDELAALLGAWDRAAAGAPGTTGLTAPVGMGKSRVLLAFLDEAEPARLVRAECRLYQAATPYFPFRALLRQALGLPESDGVAEALAESVTRRAHAQLPWLALLGEVLGVEVPPSPEVRELEDRHRPARTRDAVHATLSSALSEPTVLLIEDTHWMDDSSRELLAGLGRVVTDEPWLFLLTSRPLETDEDPPWDHHVELGPLSDDAASRLLVAASADDPLLPSQVTALVERGEGRPLFLFELLAALQQGRDTEELPDSVEQLIAARIDRLAAGDRSMLRRLAVLGTGFRVEYTASVLDEDTAGPMQRDLALGRLRQFVTADDRGWVQFQNTLVRDVAYEGLPYRTRTTLHARVGDSILASTGDHPEAEAELLSVHYHRARRWDDSWRYSRIAGDTARSLFANQDAATFYRRAQDAARHLDLPRRARGEVALGLAEVLERAGFLDDALGALGRAMRQVGDDDLQRAEILLRRAQVRMRKAAYPQALRDTAVGLRLLEAAEGREATGLRAQLRALRSSVRMAQQRPAEALAIAEAAIADANDAQRRDALARASAIMDWAYFVLGEPDLATHSPEAVTIYESLGMLDRASDVVNNMGGFAYYLGDWDGAVAHVARSRDLSARAGNDVQAASTGVNLGELLVSQGRTEEAEPVLAESQRVLQAAGDRDGAINAELQMARLLLRRGDTDRAREMLAEVRAQANELGQLQFAYEAVLYLAECLVREGDADDALDLVHRATERAGERAAMFRPQRARVVARALVVLGRLDEAGDELADGLAAAREVGLAYEEALLRVARLDLASTGDEADPEEQAAVTALLDGLGVQEARAAV
ncbi:adenylate/guanylate cyclase domain-containing protein [Salsipaludibacter albus]|uniref:adenylate/guanylate cyclase domain-containing protein n=1 Tax=Salsipaludibacter albus TaxID=2849650 RepID=UPI001EE42D12|nr:adenylate/guanylate cyclase domain-containing protein [Salsipaludibacter albus]MBY5162973.1 AAA family ATPase [Salsipaludibacter albus]